MPFDPEFQGLLADVSEIYTGEKCFWLRLLLYDHCSGALLSRRNVTGHDLFNQLNTRGYISYEPKDASCTDVELLEDIAEVTQDEGALQIIQKFKENHKNNNSNYNFRKGKPISEYRKHLFQVLESNTTDLLAKMPGHYGLNPADFNNVWNLVFKLEGSKALEEGNIEKMEHFAKILDEDAKWIFLQTVNAPAKASAQPTTQTLARTAGQALTQTTAQVTQASAQQTQASAPAATTKSRKVKAVDDEESNSGSGSNNESETKSKKQMKQIMISYKITRQVTVKKIVKRLQKEMKETHTIWIDYSGINNDIMEDIEKGIKESNIALICLSKEYEKCKYCKKECEIIQDNDIPFIPLMLEKYEPEDTNSNVQQLIKGKLREYFTDDTMFTETNYDNLVKRIKDIEKK